MKSETKTPQFDSLLNLILEKLVPHRRMCKWKGEHVHCEEEFEILTEDISFFKMLRVPPPNFCSTCRRMQRYVHIGQLKLFKRICNAPEHDESMISILPQECPFSVYDYKYFISDEFNPFSYGKQYDENKSPMKQLFEMRKSFPMPSFLKRDPSSINSDYTDGGKNLKNGYYTIFGFDSEDIWYSHAIRNSKDVMDSRLLDDSSHVYRGILSQNIYKSSFIYFSKNCIDSMFLFDCRNCSDCFGCVNLRNKKYYIWNKQLTKEKYEEFIKLIYPISIDKLKKYKEKFWQLVKNIPMNASRNVAVENVAGVMVSNSRNLYDVNSSRDSENIRYADGCFGHSDSMEVLYSGGTSSVFYSTINTGSQSNNVKFSLFSGSVLNSEFIFNSKNIKNCFMCFNLQNKSYCILNKQYSPEEYFLLLDKIKSDMLKRREYGDGLPMNFSAQSYNFSLGQINFPLSDEEILRLGGYIAKEPKTNAGDVKILSVDEIPKTIDQTREEVVDCALRCEVSDKLFRIISSELQFYRKMKLPLPTVHPTIRMQEALILSPDGKKYKTYCAKCQKETYSLFNPKDGFVLYCEKCYQQEVY